MISAYWRSAVGHGGPAIDAMQMEACARLGLDLGFDVYFTGADSDAV